MPNKISSGKTTSYSKTPLAKSDASRIQSSQAKSGKEVGKGSFAARAQSAGAKNNNININTSKTTDSSKSNSKKIKYMNLFIKRR